MTAESAPGTEDGFGPVIASPIFDRDAAPWVTELLQAGYYALAPRRRALEHLRLVLATLTTYWYRKPGRVPVGASDLDAFRAAYGSEELGSARGLRGVLTRSQLELGARRLLGEWFVSCFGRPDCQGHGVVFESPAQRARYDPRARLALVQQALLDTPTADVRGLRWRRQPAVALGSERAALALLSAPESFPALACECGWLTALRAGGLAGQSFELDAVCFSAEGNPSFACAYLSVSAHESAEDLPALRDHCERLEQRLREDEGDAAIILPYAARPLLAFELSAHAGQPLGDLTVSFVLYARDGRAWLSVAIGSEPRSGVSACDAWCSDFFGGGEPRRSLPHQLAVSCGAAA